MSCKVPAIVALLCALNPAAVAAQEGLQGQLTSQYQEKVLVLRHPYQSRAQEYAEDGAPLKRGEEGPWTLYGRMLVNKVSVDPDRLTVEGKRVLYFFDKNGKMTELQDDRKHPAEDIKITVHLQKPLSSLDEAATILGHVFALTPEDVVNSAPAWWQAYLAKQLGVQDQKEQGSRDLGGVPEKGDIRQGRVVRPSDFDKNNRDTPPRILYQPEPQFTDRERAHRFEGVVGVNVVVDSTGKATNIKIVHPLGMGLDEDAVRTVSTWRFSPATHDGHPVAVGVYIEVDFHLYN